MSVVPLLAALLAALGASSVVVVLALFGALLRVGLAGPVLAAVALDASVALDAAVVGTLVLGAPLGVDDAVGRAHVLVAAALVVVGAVGLVAPVGPPLRVVATFDVGGAFLAVFFRIVIDGDVIATYVGVWNFRKVWSAGSLGGVEDVSV